jgi:hypothetical protein
MAEDKAHVKSSSALSDFVKTHCMTCAAGWTRRIADRTVAVVCLLDRELVPAEMSACDRYETRDEAQQAHLGSAPKR